MRGVADYLPSKEGAHLPKWLRLIVAKHDDVLGIEEHDEVIAVTPKGHQPFRTLDVGGQPNLKRFFEGVGSLVGDRDDWPTLTRP
jgi:hypothetical protein